MGLPAALHMVLIILRGLVQCFFGLRVFFLLSEKFALLDAELVRSGADVRGWGNLRGEFGSHVHFVLQLSVL